MCWTAGPGTEQIDVVDPTPDREFAGELTFVGQQAFPSDSRIRRQQDGSGTLIPFSHDLALGADRETMPKGPVGLDRGDAIPRGDCARRSSWPEGPPLRGRRRIAAGPCWSGRRTGRTQAVTTNQFGRAFDLTGKVAIPTGDARGIGGSIARLFAERGARLALVDRSDAVHEAAARLGPTHLAYVADVADEVQARTVVADVVTRAGSVDILLNNAGIVRLARAEAIEASMWDETMAINLRGPFLRACEAGKAMLAAGKGGRIVNMASQTAVIALDGHLA